MYICNNVYFVNLYYLASFGAESFVFQVAVQEIKD